MRRRHVSLAVTVLIAALAAPTQAGWSKGIEGSGNLETRTLDLKDFDAIELGGAFTVEVKFGDQQKVDVTIDDNLWDNLEADVSGGTFALGWDKNCDPDDDCRIEITVRKLERLEVHGACEALVHDFDGEKFEFNVHGAAELDINGTVDELEIHISGAGEVNARDLKAKDVTVRISGAGEGEVYASESIDAHISGAGELDYWGSPDKKSTKVSGVGSIDSH